MKSNKNLILLITGQSISNLGDVFYIVSVISILYSLTGSATVSAMVVSSLLTPLLLGKYRLKTLLVWTQGFKFVLLVGLLQLFNEVSQWKNLLLYTLHLEL